MSFFSHSQLILKSKKEQNEEIFPFLSRPWTEIENSGSQKFFIFKMLRINGRVEEGSTRDNEHHLKEWNIIMIMMKNC